MIIKQVSVNIENKVGASWQVFQMMADSQINILSYSIEDFSDHGTLRLIVDDTTRAVSLLCKGGFEVVDTSVYVMNVPNKTGTMCEVLRYLAEQSVSVDFMYAFQYRGISQAVIHSTDMERLEQTLKSYERQRLSL